MRHGTLIRQLVWQDAEGRRTSVVQRRLVSMKDEHLAGLETTFTAENWSGTLEVRSGLDGRVVNAGVKRYRDLNGRHLAVLGQAEVDAETVDLQVETTQSHVRVALAARTRLLRDGQVAEADRRLVEEPGFVAHELAFELEEGRPATVEKVVALYTSRDRAVSESRDDARLTVAGAEDFAGTAGPARRAPGTASGTASTSSSTAPTSGPRRSCTCTSSTCCRPSRPTPSTWTSAFRRAAGTGRPTGATSSGTSCSSSRSSTSSGRSWPAALLDYRHARLGAARAAARAAGYQGAMFPWQSGSNGQEETQTAPPQPEVGALAARPLPPPAARQHRHRLQRLAALHGHREHRVPALRRRRAADRDRPLLGQPRHLRRRGGPLRDPRRHGPRRVPRGLPGLRRAGPAQQHLHERHGGLGAAAGAGGAGGPAAALPPGAGRGARRSATTSWTAGATSPAR